MNVYEAMRYIRTQVTKRNSNSEMWSSLDEIERVANAYDALAPDWENAPDWAQWYAIDASGSAGMFGQEPEIEDHMWVIEWTEESELPVEAMTVELPLGIDWRLCKWSRPEAK